MINSDSNIISIGCKNKQSRKRQARADIKASYQELKEINRTIELRAKALGIELRTQPIIPGGPADSVKGRKMAKCRNDRVLQAIYTLMEDNILHIELRGIVLALTDDGIIGKDLIKFFCNKYLPSVEAHQSWGDKSDQSNAAGFIQQAFKVKMMLDIRGYKIDDILKLLDQLQTGEQS
jgi:hypothetical protein